WHMLVLLFSLMSSSSVSFCTALLTSTIYTLSLHDALPISSKNVTIVEMGSLRFHLIVRGGRVGIRLKDLDGAAVRNYRDLSTELDRKSTRLNSSHEWISYAVFCLKKKKKISAT